MNEIIEALIKWCSVNRYEIRITTFDESGHYIIVTLAKGKKRISHEFYFGGVMDSECWKRYRCDLELAEFLKEAENVLR